MKTEVDCLPCPYCGSLPYIEPDYEYDSDENRFLVIGCENEHCGSSISANGIDRELVVQELKQKWNRRA